jgi:hypothetical protein
VRQAVECLLSEGYLAEESGSRGARLMRFQKPFLEESA